MDRGLEARTPKLRTTNTDCIPPADGTCISRGPFGVPGRSLFATDVTVSAASLSSSLITFFSPPTEVFRATSAANAGGVTETFTNSSGSDVTVTNPGYPPGCCPASEDSHQLRCGDACVFYLSDPNNCGACGNVCGPRFTCSNGDCEPVCNEGQALCEGQCVTLSSDDGNCGSCGNACGEGTCCVSGECSPPCAAGRGLCDGECVDFTHDTDHRAG